MSHDLRRKLLYSLVFALLLYIALALWNDWAELSAALLDFPWLWIVVVILLTLANYGGRLLRWQWMLNKLGVKIALADTARIFATGMLMVMTPGKAGELLKAYMIKNVTGTAMSVTAPTILAERVIDGAAMVMLASVGLISFPDRAARTVAVVFFVGFLIGVAIIQSRPLALRLLNFGEHIPFVKRFVSQLHRFYESAYIIFGPRNLLIALVIGLLCWSAEGVAYYIVLTGFGAPAGLDSLFKAVFIFNISTVIGAALALPGGLGGVEGSMVALSIRLLGLSGAVATAAALLTRFCTLWMGIGIGAVAFLLWPKLLASAEAAQQARPAESEEPV